MEGNNLNARQVRFCQEYVTDFHGTRAAIAAGYSEDTAAVIASENLKKPNIDAYIAELQKDAANALQITRERVLAAWKSLAYYDARAFYNAEGNLVPIPDLPDEAAFALTGFEVDELYSDRVSIGQTKKIKMSDRTKALEMLSKYLGLFEKDNEQSKTVIEISGMEIK